MKASKAIEILILDKTCDFEGDSKDLEDAIQLGIEALKRIHNARIEGLFASITPLLGETLEEVINK